MILATADAPRYDSEGWADDIAYPESLDESRAASKLFFAAQAQHRTRASRVQDLGRGIAAFGASVFVFAASLRIRGWSSVRRWRSPRHAWKICAAAFGSWLALAGANIWWLTYTAERGDHPWWADTLTIPIVGVALLAAAGVPMLAIVLVVSLRRAPLPASVTDLKPSVRFWLATASAGLVALLVIQELIYSIREGATLLVVAVVFALGAVAAWWPAAAARRVA